MGTLGFCIWRCWRRRYTSVLRPWSSVLRPFLVLGCPQFSVLRPVLGPWSLSFCPAVAVGMRRADSFRMGVYRFEDLRVWQAAKKQCDRIGELRKRPESRGDRELTEELNDAGISAMANISEGFLRHRDKEFLQFLRISAGSNGEVKSCYYAALGRGYLSAEEGAELIEDNERIARMLRRLTATLKP